MYNYAKILHKNRISLDRLIKKFIICVLTILALLFLVFPAYSRNIPPQPTKYSYHVVKPGDTLSEIAQQYNPDIDWRTVVEWIDEANGLPEGYILQPGDVLNIPNPNGEYTEPLGQD
jgi:hypothetical protein